MFQITCVPLINSLPADIICDSFDLVVVQWNRETQTLRRAKSILCGQILLPSAMHLEERLTVSQLVSQSGKRQLGKQASRQAGRNTQFGLF